MSQLPLSQKRVMKSLRGPFKHAQGGSPTLENETPGLANFHTVTGTATQSLGGGPHPFVVGTAEKKGSSRPLRFDQRPWGAHPLPDRSLRYSGEAFFAALQLEDVQKALAIPSTGSVEKVPPNTSPTSTRNAFDDRAMDVVCEFLSTSFVLRCIGLTSMSWRASARRVARERRLTLIECKGEDSRAILRQFSDDYIVVRYSKSGITWEGCYDEESKRHGQGTLTLPSGDFAQRLDPRDIHVPGITFSLHGAHCIRGYWASDIFITGTVHFRNGDIIRVHQNHQEYRFHEADGTSICTMKGGVLRNRPGPGVILPSVAILCAAGQVPYGFLRNVSTTSTLGTLRGSIDSTCPGLHPEWHFAAGLDNVTVGAALPRNHGQYLHCTDHTRKGHRKRCGWPVGVVVHNDVVHAIIIHNAPRDGSSAATMTGTTPPSRVSPMKLVYHSSQHPTKSPPRTTTSGGFGVPAVRSLKNKAKVRERETVLLNQMYEAVQEGNIDEINVLLGKHNSTLLNLCNNFGHTPLHFAAECGQKEIVEHLISSGARLVVCDGQGNTALHCAAKNGHTGVIAVLLQHEAIWEHIDDQNHNGKTALHLALERKFVNTALCLVEQGARTDIADPHGGFTQAMLARLLIPDLSTLCAAKDMNSLRSFLKCLPTRTILKSIPKPCMTRREDISQAALEEQFLASLAVEKHDGVVDQSLMYAFYLRLCMTKGSIAFPLQNSLSVETGKGHLCKNTTQISILHEMAEKGDVSIVDLLLQCTLVDVNATNASGQTALHRAVATRKHAVACLLMSDARCIVSIQDTQGRTPLHLAVQSQAYDTVTFLIHRMTVSEVQLCDIYGHTAFQYACSRCSSGSIALCFNVFLKIQSIDFEPPKYHHDGERNPIRKKSAKPAARRPPRSIEYTVYSRGGFTPALRSVFAETHASILGNQTITFRGLTLLAHAKGTSVAGFDTAVAFPRPSLPPSSVPTSDLTHCIATCASSRNYVVLEHLLQRNRTIVGSACVMAAAHSGSLQCVDLLLRHSLTEVPTHIDGGIPLCLGLLRCGYSFEWMRLGLPYFDPLNTAWNLFEEIVKLSKELVENSPTLEERGVFSPNYACARKPLNYSHRQYQREKSQAMVAVMQSVLDYFAPEMRVSPRHPLCRMVAEVLVTCLGTPFFNLLFDAVKLSRYFLVLKEGSLPMPTNYATASHGSDRVPLHPMLIKSLQQETDFIRLLDVVILDDVAAVVQSLCNARYFQAALVVIRRNVQEDNLLNFRYQAPPIEEKPGSRKEVEEALTSLHMAAYYGKTDLCLALLGTGNFRIEEPTPLLGLTALHYAALGGHPQTLVALLKAGACVDILCENSAAAIRFSPGGRVTAPEKSGGGILGLTPLHLASFCTTGEHAVRVLLQSGANPQRMDLMQNTPLHIAAYRGNRGIAAHIMESTKSFLNFPNRGGDTPILLAARQGHDLVVSTLLNCPPRDASKMLLLSRNMVTGHTLGHYAAMHGQNNLLETIGKFERTRHVGGLTAVGSVETEQRGEIPMSVVDSANGNDSAASEEVRVLIALSQSVQQTGFSRDRFPLLGQILPMGSGVATRSKTHLREVGGQRSVGAYHEATALVACDGSLPGIEILAAALNMISPNSVDLPPAKDKTESHTLPVLNPLDLLFQAAAERLAIMKDSEAFSNLYATAEGLRQAGYHKMSDPQAGALKGLYHHTIPADKSCFSATLIIKGEPCTPLHYALAQGKTECVETILKFCPEVSDFLYGIKGTSSDAETRGNVIDRTSPKLAMIVPCPLQPSAELRRKATIAEDALKPPVEPTPPPPVQWVPGYYAELLWRVHRDPVLRDSPTCSSILRLVRATFLPKLMWAARYNVLSALRSAFTLMVDTKIVSDEGITPLMVATWFGNFEAANLLLEKRAIPDQGVRLQNVTAGKLTALHVACIRNQHQLVSLLLSRNSTMVDIQDECGNTPLHLACARNSFCLIKELLCGDANIFICNNASDTAEIICVHLRNADSTRIMHWWTLASRCTSADSQVDALITSIPTPPVHNYVASWFRDSNMYHARMDAFKVDDFPMAQIDPNESIPCLLYHKICRFGGEVGARSVLNQLVFHRWPEHVKEIDMAGTFVGEKGFVHILQLLTVLPNVETVDFSGNSLSNSSVLELCHYVESHPGLRRLILNNNKGIGRRGGSAIMNLLLKNSRILYVDVSGTQIGTPVQEKMRFQTEGNKRILAQNYAKEVNDLRESMISVPPVKDNQLHPHRKISESVVTSEASKRSGNPPRPATSMR